MNRPRLAGTVEPFWVLLLRWRVQIKRRNPVPSISRNVPGADRSRGEDENTIRHEKRYDIMVSRYRVNKAAAALLLSLSLSVALLVSPAWAGKKDRPVTLKVALLPIFDVLPFYVAQASGYFNSDRVKVIGLPVGSGIERDQLLQAGETDGVLNEMTTVVGFNREAIRVKVVSTARHPVAGHPLFRLLSAPGSGISTPRDLAGVPIAVSTNTIIEYVTDRLLAAEGLTPGQIVKASVPVIPERYQLLMMGRLKAAMIPDPLAKSAMMNGAGLILDDAETSEFSVSVLTFTVEAVDGKADAIRFFLKGWDRAAGEINKDPNRWRDLLLKNIRVPKNIGADVAIPPFPRNSVPSAAQWADVLDWMTGKGLIDGPVSYEKSVTGAFLPAPAE
jgi:NitT/TauT family transport system substrate-binding protein